jgi:hypothetical protein
VAHYDGWIVLEDAVTITVPAGTFTNAVHVQRLGAQPNENKDYWFVKGVGKVLETGKQVEQLVDCVVGGKTCAELVAAQ